MTESSKTEILKNSTNQVLKFTNAECAAHFSKVSIVITNLFSIKTKLTFPFPGSSLQHVGWQAHSRTNYGENLRSICWRSNN